MKPLKSPIDETYDVVVVGSGAAGLTAAAVCAEFGKKVIVLEKSGLIGGTSAVSGGMLWVADNLLAREAGLRDSRAAAREYVEAASRGRGRAELFDAAIDHGNEMLEFVAQRLGVRFLLLEHFPDYRSDLPGWSDGGRAIEPALFNSRDVVGELASYIRTDGRLPFTMQEYEAWGSFTRFPWGMLEERRDDGYVAKGQALVAMLFAACLERGVDFAVKARVARLRSDGGTVDGVELEDGTVLSAAAGVVIASGGFEWDEELADGLLQTRLYTKCSPPSNTGDGLRMAQRLGSRVAGTREAWWAPMAVIPGDMRDGRQIGTLLRFERQGPGSIMVNRHGDRFANESQNYNDLARSLHSWDPANSQTLNTPAHIVFDQAYLTRYGILSHRAGTPTPGWLVEGDSLSSLAAKIGVPSERLESTVARFNAFARAGVDDDFRRGQTEYDRYWGDADNPWPNPSLAPLETGPYYALEVVNGAFGTSGGIATSADAQVLDVDGDVIDGLYAAGNVAQSPFGAGYPGAGATLGPLMTMAFLAAKAIVGTDALAGG